MSVADLDLSDVAVRRTSEDTRIIEAALEYRAACAAIRGLWLALLESPVGTEARTAKAGVWLAGTVRIQRARTALLELASGRTGAFETGAEQITEEQAAGILATLSSPEAA